MYDSYSAYLRRFPWKLVDWSVCPRTFVDYKGDTEFRKEDINDFVDNLIREISRQIGFQYSAVLYCIKEENVPFFNAKERLFASERKWHFEPNAPEIIALQQLLKMPDIGNPHCRVEQILALFEALPSSEKLEVLAHMNLFEVTVSKVKKDG